MIAGCADLVVLECLGAACSPPARFDATKTIYPMTVRMAAFCLSGRIAGSNRMQKHRFMPCSFLKNRQSIVMDITIHLPESGAC